MMNNRSGKKMKRFGSGVLFSQQTLLGRKFLRRDLKVLKGYSSKYFWVRSIPRGLALGQEVPTTSRKVREGSVWEGENDQRLE